jgi:hypothetical protein
MTTQTNKEIAADDTRTPENRKYLPIFNLVSPTPNWKVAINTTVDPIDLVELNATKADLADAVEFFTGSKATITREGSKYHVVAAGYYAVCGA